MSEARLRVGVVLQKRSVYWRYNSLQVQRSSSISSISEHYFDGLVDEAINSRGFERFFSPGRLKAYRESFQELKGNWQVCATTVGMPQNLLLADRGDVDHTNRSDSEDLSTQRGTGEGHRIGPATDALSARNRSSLQGSGGDDSREPAYSFSVNSEDTFSFY